MNIEKIKELYDQLNPPSKNQNANNKDDSNFLKLEVGTTTVRILPQINEEDMLFTKKDMHKVTNAEGNDQYFLCLKLFDKSCPLCDAYFMLYKVHNLQAAEAGADPKKFESFPKQVAKSLKKWERYMMNVLVRDTNEVKILDAGVKLANKIVGLMMDPDIGDITDIKSGRDFKIIKEIISDYPNYDQSTVKVNSSPVASSKAEIDEILSKRHDLGALVAEPDYTEVKTAADFILSSFTEELSKVEVRKNKSNNSLFLNKLEE